MQFLQFLGKADENHSTVLHWVEKKNIWRTVEDECFSSIYSQEKKKELFWILNANENCRAQNKSLWAK